MGLLLESLAGGLAAGAESMGDNIHEQIRAERQQAIDEAKMRMADKISAEREQKRQSDLANVLKEITGEGAEAKEGQGGYDPKAFKNLGAEEQAKYIRKGLLDRGITDTTPYDKEIDRYDKAAAQDSKNALTQWKLEMTAKFNDAKTQNDRDRISQSYELGVAKIEAAKAKSSNGSVEDRLYAAYVNDVKTNGRKNSKGQMSKVPLSFDLWNTYEDSRKAKLKEKDNSLETTATKTMNDDGSETTHTIKGKPKLSVTPKGVQSWESYKPKK